MTEPPAASIFSLAVAENRSAVMFDLDRDLAGAEHLDRVAVAHGALGDEVGHGHVATLGEQRREAVEVDDLELHLNGFLKPRSFGRRMWSGMAPPSKRSGTW